MTPYPIDFGTALQLTLARQHLAKGESLASAAQACGMGTAELDLGLWRTLGERTMGGGR